MKRRLRNLSARILPLLLLGLTLSGCAAAAVAARALPPAKIPAAYRGLAAQPTAVMVWADRGLRIDYPTLQLDTATVIQNKLQQAQAAKSKELVDTTFPVRPASIVRYQRDNPRIEGMPVVDVAPKLAAQTGLTRLIYIEIDDFETRPNPQVALYRGSVTGSVRVVEIADGRAKVVYEESDIRAAFPRKSSPDGVPSGNDVRMYQGAVDEFTTEVVKRFITHEEEEE